MKVALRKWRLEDAQQLVYLCKGKSLRSAWNTQYAYPSTIHQAKKCIAFYQSANPLRFRIYAILYKEISCGFIQVEVKSKGCAEISYWLGEVYREQHIMRQAVHLACQYSFEELLIRTIYARVDMKNIASQKVLLANGFIETKEMVPIYMYFLHML